MGSIKSRFARKAAKSTVKHTARGAGSKLRRDPLRSGVLLAAGAALGLVAGWLIARPSAAPSPG
jgi:hypothetical protein